MRHQYKIHGMTCQGCRSMVEKILSQVAGVESVTVDLKGAEASIEMATHIELSTFQKALEDAGGHYSITLPVQSKSEVIEPKH